MKRLVLERKKKSILDFSALIITASQVGLWLPELLICCLELDPNPFSLDLLQVFTPQTLRAVGVLFSPMVSGWTGGRAGVRAGGWAGAV